MHILLVFPNSSEAFLAQNKPLRLAHARKGLELEVCNLPQAPQTLEGCIDEAIAAPHLIKRIIEAREQSYDAVIIDCATNVAVQATRELEGIMIVHAGEAALSAALLLGEKISIIAINDKDAANLRYKIAADSLDKRVISIRTAQVEMDNLIQQEAIELIQRTAYAAWKEDGANVLILGCTGMSAILPEIQKVVPIPVIDPSVAAIKTTCSLLEMQN